MNEEKETAFHIKVGVVDSTFIKVKVELLSNLVILLLDRDSNLANVTLCAIVDAAIIEDELHVLHKLLDALVLVLLKLCLDSGEVHRVLHHEWVVKNAQLLIVHRISKDVGLLVPLEQHEHSLGGPLPLVENRGAFRHLRHLKLFNAFELLSLL